MARTNTHHHCRRRRAPDDPARRDSRTGRSPDRQGRQAADRAHRRRARSLRRPAGREAEAQHHPRRRRRSGRREIPGRPAGEYRQTEGTLHHGVRGQRRGHHRAPAGLRHPALHVDSISQPGRGERMESAGREPRSAGGGLRDGAADARGPAGTPPERRRTPEGCRRNREERGTFQEGAGRVCSRWTRRSTRRRASRPSRRPRV